jgi:Kef-type K+ transport system membrane component KefB
MRLPGGVPVGGGASGSSTFAQTISPLAIVLLVLIIGASIYLWRKRYLQSRAALVTIAAIVVVLIYLGFFAIHTPT